jgi:hypothetical protein
MNTPAEFLDPDAVDALLSADLDGELADAAADLGLDEAEARERLAATPGVDARRIVLTRARDLLASPPAMPAAVEERLVAAATVPNDLAVARDRRRRAQSTRRVAVAIGSVAAAIAVVVGIANIRPSTSSSSKAASAALTPTTSAHAPVESSGATGSGAGSVDFGDVTHASALRATARSKLAERKTVQPATTQPGAVDVAGGAGNTQADGAKATSSTKEFAASDSCLAAIRRRERLTTAPTLVGTGIVDGSPVQIFVFDEAGTSVAYVVRPGGCTLVRKDVV